MKKRRTPDINMFPNRILPVGYINPIIIYNYLGCKLRWRELQNKKAFKNNIDYTRQRIF